MHRQFSQVAAFDDAPFQRSWRGDVTVIGTVYAGLRLDGVLSTRVRRDGANATARLATCLMDCRFYPQLQAVLLQGIALAGFNVVDLRGLHRITSRPVLVIARHLPDLPSIQQALLDKVPGGKRKWRLIQEAGPMEAIAGVQVQRAGLSINEAHMIITALQCHGKIPEPLRVAHLIAGGVTLGESRHRV